MFTLVNVVSRALPRATSAEMTAIATSALMRPYSTAVAPESSRRNLASMGYSGLVSKNFLDRMAAGDSIVTRVIIDVNGDEDFAANHRV